MNGLSSPHHTRRCCCKCKGLDNTCHTFFCIKGKPNEDWNSFIVMLQKCEIDTNETICLEKEGLETCKNFEGIDTENMPDEIKIIC